ncbi:MAG: peptide ABC transporter substrate-binding protein [Bdellovibrionota bacterium]
MAHIKTFSYKNLIVKISLIVAVMLLTTTALKAEEPVFKFFLTMSPQTLNPAHFYGTETTYLVSNLFRGLYRVDSKKGIVPEGAEKCSWDGLKLKCILNKNVKWSDGVSVKAQDYERAFRHLINPESKSREVAHLLKLKNAKKILEGSLKPEALGVTAQDDFNLIFEFETKDPEFIARLTSTVLVPWRVLPDIKRATEKNIEILVNGPYKLKNFNNKKAYLVKNDFYPFGNPSRPDVEIYYVEESSTGQNLFDLGKIDLVHQLVTAFIPKYKDKDMFNVLFSRFDYIGFGPELEGNIHFRKALAMSVDYEELKKLIYASGMPGCPSLTDTYIDKRQCYTFDVKAAQNELKKVPKELLEKKLTIKFSRASGEELSRIIEWYQNQWKKNLGVNIQIEMIEQGMYLQDLKTNTPALFRKGVVLDRPTCLSALETFQKDNVDNFIKFSNENYEKILKKLEFSENEKEKKKLCSAGIKILMDEYRIIPQGVLHYTMLKSDRFQGIEFNELNQLNLCNLRSTRSKR